MALRALIGQMMSFKLVAAFGAAHERRHFGQGKRGVLGKAAFFFYNVETETDVVAAMAGERVKADFNGFDTLRVLCGGLLFDGVNDVADKMNFMHKLCRFLPS